MLVMKTKNIVIGIVIIVIIAGGIFWLIKTPGKPGQYDTFAQCLGEKGAKFFGAFWCPHCRDQKALFGRSASLLPYTECSTPDGKGTLQVCLDQKIQGYPTWEFAGGERIVAVMSLEELSEKTSCPLP